MRKTPLTRKLIGARKAAADLFPDPKAVSSGVLYKALSDAGYAWDKRTGWQLADPDFVSGRRQIAADVLHVRLSGDLTDALMVANWLREMCTRAGLTVNTVSRPYKNKTGSGVRVYLQIENIAQLLPFQDQAQADQEE